MSAPPDIVGLLDELQSLARTGLHYAPTPYDRDRYGRLLALALAGYQGLFDAPQPLLRARFAAEVGCITPKVGADAAIFDADGRILLMDRADGSGWCLPCGWVEPGERPVDCCVRETREETGLDVKARRLVGVFSRPASAENGPHSMVAVVHLCDVIGGQLALSHEGKGLDYRAIDEVRHWHANHETYARAALRAWRDGAPAVSQ